MEFEYDSTKSASNREKHRIDFEDAKKLWNDPRLVQVEALTSDEKRYIVIGKIEDNYWSAIITYRDERTRIISVRRSRDNEIKLYEES